MGSGEVLGEVWGDPQWGLGRPSVGSGEVLSGVEGGPQWGKGAKGRKSGYQWVSTSRLRLEKMS